MNRFEWTHFSASPRQTSGRKPDSLMWFAASAFVLLHSRGITAPVSGPREHPWQPPSCVSLGKQFNLTVPRVPICKMD